MVGDVAGHDESFGVAVPKRVGLAADAAVNVEPRPSMNRVGV
jgi:hypothetical protein